MSIRVVTLRRVPLALVFCILLSGCGDGEGQPQTRGDSAWPRTGAVKVNGQLNLCPWLDPVTALPLETTVGHTIWLIATATDADSVTTPLEVKWQADNGWTAVGSTVQFPCTCAGEFLVSAAVSDGDTSCDSSDAARLDMSTTTTGLTCSEPYGTLEN